MHYTYAKLLKLMEISMFSLQQLNEHKNLHFCNPCELRNHDAKVETPFHDNIPYMHGQFGGK